MKDNIQNHQEWFNKARDDELSYQALLKDKEGAPSTVCFLAQQAVEKYLKGLLIFFNKPYPKVHDLLRLETLLIGHADDISEIHSHLIILNRYYIETRYPGDYPEIIWSEANEAANAAAETKDYILNKTRS